MFRKTLNDAGLNSVRIHAFDNPGNDADVELDSPARHQHATCKPPWIFIGNHCLQSRHAAARDCERNRRAPQQTDLGHGRARL